MAPSQQPVFQSTSSSHATPLSHRTIKTKDPVPTPRRIKLHPLTKLPLHGPVPATTISVPSLQNRTQMEELLTQFVSDLRADRLYKEGKERNKLEAGRPTFKPDEFPEFRQILMGPWNTGPSHGILLDGTYFHPEVVTLLPSFQINPRLSATPSCQGGYIHWDVTQPASTAQFFGENETSLSFAEFCDEPATAPRLPEIELISRSFHWVFNTHAREVVTVGVILETLSLSLLFSMSHGFLEELSEEYQASAWRGYRKRCANGDEDKHRCPRLVDILDGNTMFGGLSYDQEYEEERKFDKSLWKLHLLVTYLPGDI